MKNDPEIVKIFEVVIEDYLSPESVRRIKSAEGDYYNMSTQALFNIFEAGLLSNPRMWMEICGDMVEFRHFKDN